MKKFILLVLGTILLTTNTYAVAMHPKPCLHTINFQLQAEEWAKTTTARVIVDFNGTTHTEELTNLHNQVLEDLAQLSSKADWHITQFTRQQDKSGLEKVYIQAETRLPESELANLRQIAKDISKPGATFEINDIQFSPSLDDIQQTKTDLRQKIYTAAQTELTHLNKIYPDDHYRLHQISFLNGAPIPMERKMVLAAGAPQATFSVSQKIVMTANVQLIKKMEMGMRKMDMKMNQMRNMQKSS